MKIIHVFNRFFFVAILLLACQSCTTFFSSEKQQHQNLDSIIDFTKVDVSPSFKVCDSLIDNEKTICFRNTLHEKLTEQLRQHNFKVHEKIDEIINVHVLIDNKGKVQLQDINTSEVVQKQLPKLDSILNISVCQLPKLRPAYKQGIPVTTQYQLPIRIVLED